MFKNQSLTMLNNKLSQHESFLMFGPDAVVLINIKKFRQRSCTCAHFLSIHHRYFDFVFFSIRVTPKMCVCHVICWVSVSWKNAKYWFIFVFNVRVYVHGQKCNEKECVYVFTHTGTTKFFEGNISFHFHLFYFYCVKYVINGNAITHLGCT